MKKRVFMLALVVGVLLTSCFAAWGAGFSLTEMSFDKTSVMEKEGENVSVKITVKLTSSDSGTFGSASFDKIRFGANQNSVLSGDTTKTIDLKKNPVSNDYDATLTAKLIKSGDVTFYVVLLSKDKELDSSKVSKDLKFRFKLEIIAKSTDVTFTAGDSRTVSLDKKYNSGDVKISADVDKAGLLSVDVTASKDAIIIKGETPGTYKVTVKASDDVSAATTTITVKVKDKPVFKIAAAQSEVRLLPGDKKVTVKIISENNGGHSVSYDVIADPSEDNLKVSMSGDTVVLNAGYKEPEYTYTVTVSGEIPVVNTIEGTKAKAYITVIVGDPRNYDSPAWDGIEPDNIKNPVQTLLNADKVKPKLGTTKPNAFTRMEQRDMPIEILGPIKNVDVYIAAKDAIKLGWLEKGATENIQLNRKNIKKYNIPFRVTSYDFAQSVADSDDAKKAPKNWKTAKNTVTLSFNGGNFEYNGFPLTIALYNEATSSKPVAKTLKLSVGSKSDWGTPKWVYEEDVYSGDEYIGWEYKEYDKKAKPEARAAVYKKPDGFLYYTDSIGDLIESRYPISSDYAAPMVITANPSTDVKGKAKLDKFFDKDKDDEGVEIPHVEIQQPVFNYLGEVAEEGYVMIAGTPLNKEKESKLAITLTATNPSTKKKAALKVTATGKLVPQFKVDGKKITDREEKGETRYDWDTGTEKPLHTKHLVTKSVVAGKKPSIKFKATGSKTIAYEVGDIWKVWEDGTLHPTDNDLNATVSTDDDYYGINNEYYYHDSDKWKYSVDDEFKEYRDIKSKLADLGLELDKQKGAISATGTTKPTVNEDGNYETLVVPVTAWNNVGTDLIYASVDITGEIPKAGKKTIPINASSISTDANKYPNAGIIKVKVGKGEAGAATQNVDVRFTLEKGSESTLLDLGLAFRNYDELYYKGVVSGEAKVDGTVPFVKSLNVTPTVRVSSDFSADLSITFDTEVSKDIKVGESVDAKYVKAGPGSVLVKFTSGDITSLDKSGDVYVANSVDVTVIVKSKDTTVGIISGDPTATLSGDKIIVVKYKVESGDKNATKQAFITVSVDWIVKDTGKRKVPQPNFSSAIGTGGASGDVTIVTVSYDTLGKEIKTIGSMDGTPTATLSGDKDIVVKYVVKSNDTYVKRRGIITVSGDWAAKKPAKQTFTAKLSGDVIVVPYTIKSGDVSADGAIYVDNTLKNQAVIQVIDKDKLIAKARSYNKDEKVNIEFTATNLGATPKKPLKSTLIIKALGSNKSARNASAGGIATDAAGAAKNGKGGAGYGDGYGSENDQTNEAEGTLTIGAPRTMANLTAAQMAYLAANGYTVIAVLPELTADVSKQYDVNVELDEDAPEGEKMFYIPFPKDVPQVEDDEIVDFYDAEGAPIENVPAEKAIVAAPWLRENVTYEPVIAVKAN